MKHPTIRYGDTYPSEPRVVTTPPDKYLLNPELNRRLGPPHIARTSGPPVQVISDISPHPSLLHIRVWWLLRLCRELYGRHRFCIEPRLVEGSREPAANENGFEPGPLVRRGKDGEQMYEFVLYVAEGISEKVPLTEAQIEACRWEVENKKERKRRVTREREEAQERRRQRWVEAEKRRREAEENAFWMS